MTDERTYESPAAFRRALSDRLRTAAHTSKWSLQDLQRQFAYDRLLERLYSLDERWIIKGATALLARNLAVRATIDVDVYREEATRVAEADLREAASRDIGDWCRFEVGVPIPMGDGGAGVRLPVRAYIGQTVWTEFKVDLVGADLRMTGTPENVPPLAEIGIPDVEQHGYRAYPLVDHIADKIAATHEFYGSARSPSTRFKDLIDLVAIVTGASVPADEQRTALLSEVRRRGITLPARFTVPDRAAWERGYTAEAKKSQLSKAQNLEEALAIVSAFVDPLLDGTARGCWNPSTGRWE